MFTRKDPWSDHKDVTFVVFCTAHLWLDQESENLINLDFELTIFNAHVQKCLKTFAILILI